MAKTFSTNGAEKTVYPCEKNGIWFPSPPYIIYRNYLKIDQRPESKSQYFKTHRSSCTCIRWWLTKITSNRSANYVSWIFSNFSTLGYLSRQQSSEKTTQNGANFCKSYKGSSKNSWKTHIMKKLQMDFKKILQQNKFFSSISPQTFWSTHIWNVWGLGTITPQ